jgi:RHS repeat-associated protein
MTWTRGTSRTRVLVAAAAVILVAVSAGAAYVGSAAGAPVLATSGLPQAMEGNLKVSPGAVLRVGFDVSMTAPHAAATVAFQLTTVLFVATCTSTNTLTLPLVVPISDAQTTVPKDSTAWLPTADQSSAASYQASLKVPDVCHGGAVSLKFGGTFVSLVSSTDTKDKVSFRWHYSANGSPGAWSSTSTVTPGLLAAAQLSIAPTSADFGSVPVGGSSAATTFTVTNTGSLATGAVAAAVNGAQFELAFNGCAGVVLAPGASCTLKVDYAPTAAGPATGTVQVSASPGGSSSATVTGAGLAPGKLTVSPGDVSFGDVTVGSDSAPRTFTVSNAGGQPTGAVTPSLTGADFAIASTTCSGALAPGASCSVAVRFSPTTAGAASGGLAVAASPGGTSGASLSGNGIAPAHLVLNPTSADFGDVPVASTSAVTPLVVTNDGGRPSGTVAASISGAGFWIQTDGCSGSPVAPGASCEVDVAFTPDVAGLASGSFKIAGTPGGVRTGALTGNALAPGKLSLAPIAADFGDVTVGTTSDATTFVVTNIGGQKTGAVSTLVSGAGFSVASDACATTALAPGGSCTVSVSFTPTQAGSATGALQMAAGGAGTVAASLAANGVTPAQLVLSPATGGFGSVPLGASSAQQAFTVTNSGGLPSGAVSVSTATSDFTVVSDGCTGNPIAPGGTCEVDVAFAPAVAGSASSTLTATASPGGAAQTTLSGTGLAPGKLTVTPASGDFGAVAVGSTSAATTFTVKNTGDLATGTLATATTGDFTFGTDTCVGTALAAGASCTIDVAFAPTTPGAATGSVTVTGTPAGSAGAALTGTGEAAAALALDPQSVDFGSVSVGASAPETTFTITNGGGAETGALGVAVDDSHFDVTTDTCTGVRLATGSSCTVGVSFHPTTTDPVTGVLTVKGTPGGTVTAALSGTGASAGQLSVAPQTHDFGNVNVGDDSGATTFTVTNRAAAPTTELAVAVSGAGFAVTKDECTGVSLDPSATCTIAIRFSPAVDGASDGSLQVSADTGGTATSALSATGVAVPADPATPQAPALSTSDGAPSFDEQTSFLYTGANPVQEGVASGTIHDVQAAVVRGSVLDDTGAALPGVTVTVAGHPEFGSTTSRADGGFFLAVNGGQTLRVHFAKDGFVAADRSVDVPWQDYVFADPVRLVQLDAHVTEVAFGSAADQVAEGTPTSDARGDRQGTLLFPAGVKATMTMPDGSTRPLGAGGVRITEFTRGPDGHDAMPAPLPATSAYTYAADFEIDEATAAGATGVTFDKPVVSYTQNFIGFPVGSAVPAGYYDQSKGAWVAQPNGRVVKVLAVNGGVAQLDVDGSGDAATTAQLGELGIDAAELRHIADLYAPGTTLWRVPMTHFSWWDLNWAFQYGIGQVVMGLLYLPYWLETHLPHGECKSGGSIIRCNERSLGEALPVVGTPFRLAYSSARVPAGRVNTLKVPVTGATALPPTLTSVVLVTQIAGLSTTQTFAPTENITTNFTWNGRDRFKRPLDSAEKVTFRIGYVYKGVKYGSPAANERSFAQLSSGSYDLDLINETVTQWTVETVTVEPPATGVWDARRDGLGGWSPSVHSSYDPVSRTLYSGDGDTRSATGLPATPGFVPFQQSDVAGWEGGDTIADGSVHATAFCDLGGLTASPDGGFYFTEGLTGTVRKVNPDGTLTTIAGQPHPCNTPDTDGPSGDGGPARNANLDWPYGVARGPDGSLYVTEWGLNHGHSRVRRIAPDGTISTIAGIGTTDYSDCPTGSAPGATSVATETPLCQPTAIAAAPDGSVYFVDWNSEIRKISTDGMLTTILGDGTSSSDDVPVSRAHARGTIGSLAVGADGTLYFVDGWGSGSAFLREITPDGTVRAAPGVNTCTVDGAAATCAEAVATGPDGRVYFVADNGVRRIEPSGAITHLYDGASDALRAVQSEGNGGGGISVLPNGNVVGTGFSMLHWLSPPLPGYTGKPLAIPSTDGQTVDVFDPNGRQLETRNALTGATMLRFGYDSAGRVAGVTDGDNNATTIQRTSDGTSILIGAPFGQRTRLTLSTPSYGSSLVGVATLGGTRASLSYGGLDGLLTGFATGSDTSAWSLPSTFTYTADGRLRQDKNGLGNAKTLVSAGDGTDVTLRTPLGHATENSVSRGAAGIVRSATSPAGTHNSVAINDDGTVSATYADGSTLTGAVAPDPRFGGSVTYGSTATYTRPSGISRTDTESIVADLTNPSDPLSLASLTDSVTIDGHTSTSRFDRASRTFTDTSTEGRTSTMQVDDQERPVHVEPGGSIDAIDSTYDSRGLLRDVSQGARTWHGTYGSNGNLSDSTDALGKTSHFSYDGDGNVTKVVSPDQSSVSLTYLRGAIASVTPSGRAATTIARDGIEQPLHERGPGVPGGAHDYAWDPDGNLTTLTRADGNDVSFAYDDAGRETRVTAGQTSVAYTYNPTTGALATLSTPSETLSLQRDGSLLTRETLTGLVDASTSYAYDSAFRVASITPEGGVTVPYAYDGDGLDTAAGAVSIVRDPATGVVQTADVGKTSVAWTKNEFGDDASATWTFDGSPLLQRSLAYDAVGRISKATEQGPDGTTTSDYGYDDGGRLASVKRNGSEVASFTYDANGNRLTASENGIDRTFTVDASDRLTDDGQFTYTYDADGQLATRTAIDSGDVTAYHYDGLGLLRSVDLPDGTTVSYVNDAAGRRIQARVDGAPTVSFLWGQLAQPLAELGPTGAIKEQFVYGTSDGAPDYILRDGRTYRVVTDERGSPRLIVDASTGEVAEAIDYDSFGRVTRDTAPGFQPFGYAGSLHDPLTNLDHMGTRDYDPRTARFIEPDPAGLSGGTNLYTYTDADPVNSIDPDGLSRLPFDGHDYVHNLSDEVACWGDSFSFGATYEIRKLFGGDDVNYCSGYCKFGNYYAAGTQMVWGGGEVVAAARAARLARAARNAEPLIKAGSAGGKTAGKAFPRAVRDATLEDNPSTCVFCRMKTDSPQVDHAIPRARGGNATSDNAQTACPWCNASKGARDVPVNPPPTYEGPWPPPWWTQ